jgi:hypothetical protein
MSGGLARNALLSEPLIKRIALISQILFQMQNQIPLLGGGA